MQASGVIYVSRLMNSKVKNRQGETIGTLEELVVDVEFGVAAYGVMKSGGGFLKSGKLFAVPYEALDLNAEEFPPGLVVDFDQEYLRDAPTFETDRWPDMADRRWGNSVHAFFDTQPYWEDSRAKGRQDNRRDGESRQTAGEEGMYREDGKGDTAATA